MHMSRDLGPSSDQVDHAHSNLEVDSCGRYRWTGRDLALVLLASVASHLYTGIEYGLRAHTTQLPLVLKLDDPAFYPGDFFVESLQQYCSYFWIAVAGLAKLASVKWVLVASHFVSRFLLAAAVFEMTARLAPRGPARFMALAAASLRLRAVLATEALYSGLPTHTTFAFPCLVWGMLFAWRGRAIVAGLLLGLAFNLNLMTAAPAALVAAVGFIAGRPRRSSAKAFAGFAVLVLAALPAILWALRSPSPQDPVAYARVIRETFWWHFDPFAWRGAVWAQFAGLLLMLAVGLAMKPPSALDRPMLGSLAAIVATWIIAVAASRVDLLAPLLRFQFARTAALAVIISVSVAASAACAAWERRRPVDLLAIAALIVGLGLAHGRTTAAVLACAAVAADLRSTRGILRASRARIPAAACWLALAAALGLFGHMVYRRAPAGEQSGVFVRSAELQWLDVQEWIARNTPPKAMLVGPVHTVGLRVGARRSLWFGFDYDAMLWRPDLLPEIHRRHELLAPTGLADHPVERVDWERLFDLARRVGIDFAVVPASLAQSQKSAYENTRWAVVPLRPPDGSDKQAPGAASPPCRLEGTDEEARR